jgi:predicted nucleic acid-binding Zn ribbon protein
MTAKPRIKCPECGGRTKKLIGAGAGIIFKGSGFYETDYKRKSVAGGPQKRPETPTEKPAETKKENKQDSKKD